MKTLEFGRKHLFMPLGITDVKWQTNPNGITIGWGNMFLKPHDMAKIGYLSLKQGQWENRQIVSKNWMETSTRKHIETQRLSGSDFGYHWWVHPEGFHKASGAYGQRIYVEPQKNLVVVFTGSSPSVYNTVPRKLFDKYIRAAIKSE